MIAMNTWTARIRNAWQSGVTSIIETGRLLVAAKEGPERLAHGEFEAMIETDLPFDPRTAQMLMKISRDDRLTNAKHFSLLPPSWGTLYELTKLTDDVFEAKIADGTIKPNMHRDEAVRLHRASEPRHATAYEPSPAARRAMAAGRPHPTAMWRAIRESLVARRNALGMSQAVLDTEAGWASGQTAKYECSEDSNEIRAPGVLMLCEWICALHYTVALMPTELQPQTVQPAMYRRSA